jgi:hypothetical protein
MSKSKSRSLKSTGKRSFTISNAYHVDGCPTKFSNKDYTGRFTGHSAQRAAAKALTHLCHVKRIRGQCTLYIEMQETTQGSSKKVYSYHAKRVKLAKPLMIGGIERNYFNKVKSVRVPTEKCAKSHKSSGRMLSYRKSSKAQALVRNSKKASKKHSRRHTKKSSSILNIFK